MARRSASIWLALPFISFISLCLAHSLPTVVFVPVACDVYGGIDARSLTALDGLASQAAAQARLSTASPHGLRDLLRRRAVQEVVLGGARGVLSTIERLGPDAYLCPAAGAPPSWWIVADACSGLQALAPAA